MTDVYSIGFDRYAVETNAPSSRPARLPIAVTPSDTKDVTNATGDNAPCYAKSLFVGATGNLVVVGAGDNSAGGAGTPATFSNVPVGLFPVQVRRVMATGTTASGIVGLYDK